MLEKPEIALQRLLVEMWMLKVILVRAQKEKRRARKKASLFLETIKYHALSFRKDKNHPEGDSEINRVATLITGSRGRLLAPWF